MDDVGKAGQEPVVEVGHAQQYLHIQLGRGWRELPEGW